MWRLIGVALAVLAGALVIGDVSAPAPAGKEPTTATRRGGTLRVDRDGFATRLFGGYEIGRGGRANAGDRDGSGWATIALIGRQRICYSLIVSGIAKPVAAHIHMAEAGANGRIVVTLEPPDSGEGTASGCLNASPTIVRAIRARPAGFYVNVHTRPYPNGAIRGQL